MRTDVKLGVVVSMVVVFVAGGYFIFSGNDAKPIDLADNAANPATKDAQQKGPSGPQSADTSRRTPNLANRNTRQQPTRPTNPQNQPAPAGGNLAGDLAQNTRLPADANVPAMVQPNANNPANPIVNQPASNPTEVAANTGNPSGQSTIPAANDPQVPASAAEALAAMRKNAPVERPANSGPSTAAVDIHRAQPGDTFATLAQTYYGSTKYAPVLRQANPEVSDPSSIRVGTAIRIPSLPADADKLADTARTKPAASPGGANSAGKPAIGSRTYVVRPGDSFYKIAERELGKASRWKELLALNKSLVDGDPTRLRVGQKVTLPES
jgi:nucleoid-associated protein YgaU